MTKIELCRTCQHWAKPPEPLEMVEVERREFHVLARCGRCSSTLTRESGWCAYWQQRVGEPLGTGISKIWFGMFESWDKPSIIHDLRPRSAEADREWVSNCQLTSDNALQRSMARAGIVVLVGWRMIRKVIPGGE